MLKPGDLFKDFSLPDSQNKIVKLSDRLKNGPVMLVFYRYNCPTCQYAFPHLGRVAKALGNEHFAAVAQDSTAEAAAFKSKFGFDFTVVADVGPFAVSVQYGISIVPTAFVIEPEGRISAVAEGFDRKAIEDFAARLVASKNLHGFQAFDPGAQVPLLKPG